MKQLRLLITLFLMGLFFGGCINTHANPLTQTEAAMLHLMLANTNEVRIHQMRGATENTVYLGPEGHKEAVYDGNGQLVRDGMNEGSYNYAHPHNAPFEHYTKDIHPWLVMGSSRRDPTSVQERAYAYTQDIEQGLTAAAEQWNSNLVSDRADLTPPKPWVKIFGRMDKQKVFGLINGEIEMTDANLIEALKELNAAIEAEYS